MKLAELFPSPESLRLMAYTLCICNMKLAELFSRSERACITEFPEGISFKTDITYTVVIFDNLQVYVAGVPLLCSDFIICRL